MSFSINLTPSGDKTSVTIAMTLAPDDNVTSSASIARLIVADPAQLALSVHRTNNEVSVLVISTGDADDATLRILELHYETEADRALYTRRLTNHLNDEFTLALMEAIGAHGTSKSSPATSVDAAVGNGESRFHPSAAEPLSGGAAVRRPTGKSRMVTGIGLVFAVGLIVYGTFLHKHSAAVSSDPSAQLTSALPSNVQAQIDAVVHPTSGVPSNFNSTNVALSTMRAMGLNPGKAGTSCLVGLR